MKYVKFIHTQEKGVITEDILSDFEGVPIHNWLNGFTSNVGQYLTSACQCVTQPIKSANHIHCLPATVTQSFG